MLGITDLKKGTLIQIEGVPYRVVEYNQKQVGRGGSIVTTKIKNLVDGSQHSKTFKGAEKVEPAEVNSKTVQYLYSDDSNHYFMDNSSFEQYEIGIQDVDNNQLLKEGIEVTAQLFEGRVINVELPVKIPLKVTETPDVVKGDTQSTVLKEATLETGAMIQVPIFINTGDTVIVDTRDASYVERQKA